MVNPEVQQSLPAPPPGAMNSKVELSPKEVLAELNRAKETVGEISYLLSMLYDSGSFPSAQDAGQVAAQPIAQTRVTFETIRKAMVDTVGVLNELDEFTRKAVHALTTQDSSNSTALNAVTQTLA
ncbi:MAG: hypothetical protein ACRC0L_00225 [Angustibacter sp.]